MAVIYTDRFNIKRIQYRHFSDEVPLPLSTSKKKTYPYRIGSPLKVNVLFYLMYEFLHTLAHCEKRKQHRCTQQPPLLIITPLVHFNTTNHKNNQCYTKHNKPKLVSITHSSFHIIPYFLTTKIAIFFFSAKIIFLGGGTPHLCSVLSSNDRFNINRSPSPKHFRRLSFTNIFTPLYKKIVFRTSRQGTPTRLCIAIG